VTLRIEINREVCMGSGNCLFWAPGVFDLDDEGIAIVVDPAGAPEDKIALAVDGCPTRAITLVRAAE
jgi:ferredoxin